MNSLRRICFNVPRLLSHSESLALGSRFLPVYYYSGSLKLNYAASQVCFASSSSKPMYDLELLMDPRDKIILQAREKMGIKKLPDYILRQSSIYLYESCTDQIDLTRFFEHLKMEDSYNSWHSVTRFHVWMILTRCMRDKLNGVKLRNEVIKRMWEDCSARLDKLATLKTRVKRQSLISYHQEFSATLVSLDEGLLTSDPVLAGALWRSLLGKCAEPDPTILELLVAYTRTQVAHLDRIRDDQFRMNGMIQWASFPPLIEPKSS